MTEKELLKYFESKKDDFVAFLSTIIDHQSYSKNKDGINSLLDIIETRFDIFSPLKKRIKTSAGDILILDFFTDKKDLMVLLSHVDTVRVSEDFKESKIIEGKLFGNGCYDMKSAIAIFYFIIKLLTENNVIPKYGIRIILTPDEETGSRYSIEYIIEECRKAKAVLIPEPSCENGEVKIKRKGVAHINIIIQGVASHSGIAPHLGIDANKELIMILNDIYLKLENYPDVDFNTGIIAGGVQKNIVSPDSFLNGEFRSFSNDALEKLVSEMKLYESSGKPEVVVDCSISRPALEYTEKNRVLYNKAKKIAEDMGYKLEKCSTGGASDGCNLSAAKIPVVDGIGIRGNGAHTVDEYIEINDFPFRAALMTMMCIK